jgi:hypothetical protein
MPATISQAAGPKVLKLLWADEFNGKKGSLPSSKNWEYDIGKDGVKSHNACKGTKLGWEIHFCGFEIGFIKFCIF